MCGITAYCGKNSALPFLLQGLEKLEYRGYDSAGVTIVEQHQLRTFKSKGRLTALKEILSSQDLNGCVGIGHTRWATHGVPSHLNSHPHTNMKETLSLVHNGIIENYRELKTFLMKEGYTFASETDSEVVVQLLDYYYQGDVLSALSKVVSLIKGSYALCILSTEHPHEVYVTKKDSPLILGMCQDGSVAASDIPALLDYTKDVYFLEDGEMAVLKDTGIIFYNLRQEIIEKQSHHIPYDQEAAKKDGYDTFMLKEIYEQPHAIKETLRGRIYQDHVELEELKDLKEQFHQLNKVYYVACGTAYHACLSGATMFEKLTGIPSFVQVASEFRYNDPLVDEHTLCIFVSQSGETADTLAALRLAKAKKAKTIAVANVLGSTISREGDYVLYTCAGPEIAVASTKAYTTQLVVLMLIAIYAGQSLSKNHQYVSLIQDLYRLPEFIESLLKDASIFESYAHYLKEQKDCYFIGRSLDYAAVLEGALKLKEVSYVHADAYVAGELKHGPIALIEQGSVVIAVATQPHIADKTISNIQETIARGACVILLTLPAYQKTHAQEIYVLPEVHPLLQALLIAVPLQLLAYYTAKMKGCDVDKPRNLAKSVTVE